MSHLLLALGYLAPALVLVLALVCRRYPGERVLRRLAAARHARGHRSPARTGGAPASHARLPRGGRLIAYSLADRPPPAVVAVPR
jgi:hypothetical protein